MNPSSGKQWTDDEGRLWNRRGGKRIGPRRVRSLIANESVLMACWRSFDVEWHSDVESKRIAIDRLADGAASDDLRSTEWDTTRGQRALIVERFC